MTIWWIISPQPCPSSQDTTTTITHLKTKDTDTFPHQIRISFLGHIALLLKCKQPGVSHFIALICIPKEKPVINFAWPSCQICWQIRHPRCQVLPLTLGSHLEDKLLHKANCYRQNQMLCQKPGPHVFIYACTVGCMLVSSLISDEDSCCYPESAAIGRHNNLEACTI